MSGLQVKLRVERQAKRGRHGKTQLEIHASGIYSLFLCQLLFEYNYLYLDDFFDTPSTSLSLLF